MLNPRISDLVSAQFKKDCIVVFDEAHNIGKHLAILLKNKNLISNAIILNR